MNRRDALVLLAALGAAAGCSHPIWSYRNRVRTYPTENAPILVGLSQFVEAEDNFGYTAAFIEALDAEFAKIALQPKILTKRPAVLPKPRVELWLHRRDEATGWGDGPLVVDCNVFSEVEQIVFSGSIGGPFRLGYAQIMGGLIARELINGT